MKISFPILLHIISVFLITGLEGREISVIRPARNASDELPQSPPILSTDRLHEIRIYDRMKCFPKVLCTLTKTGAFAKLGTISLNGLADEYLRLLTAFPGGPPSDLIDNDNTANDGIIEMLNFKHDIKNTPSSHTSFKSDSYEDEDESHKVGNEEESEEMLLSDPKLHYKEKMEIKKLMSELMAEDQADAIKKPTSWTSTAISLPLKLGSSLLKSVVLPYLIGDNDRKSRKDESFEKNDLTNKDPIESVMKIWSKLKSPQQCGKMYPKCPFEAWEIVSMIKLIKNST